MMKTVMDYQLLEIAFKKPKWETDGVSFSSTFVIFEGMKKPRKYVTLAKPIKIKGSWLLSTVNDLIYRAG